jgi:DNA polymerase III gamma/tau subunit
MAELVHKYRPKSLDEVVGQDAAVQSLQGHIKNGGLPHAFLFTGPPGVGKTTIARILATAHLKCGGMDLAELNIGNLTSIETVRQIETAMRLSPISGKTRVYVLDEVQGMGKPAQQAFLKMLEEPPRHVYFLLCTTDPSKLLKPIRSRCTKVRLSPLSDDALKTLITKVCKKEKIKTTKRVVDKIVQASEGGARDALKYLDAVKALKSEEDQLAAVSMTHEEGEAIELARLLANPRTRWPDLKPVLKKLEGEEPEMVRRVVVSYFTSIALNGGMLGRCKQVYREFGDEFFQQGKAGFAQLLFACAELFPTK